MGTLAQPLKFLIDQQIQSGTVDTVEEVEQMILAEIEERETARKLATGLKQSENGQTTPLNDEFVNELKHHVRNKIVSTTA